MIKKKQQQHIYIHLIVSPRQSPTDTVGEHHVCRDFLVITDRFFRLLTNSFNIWSWSWVVVRAQDPYIFLCCGKCIALTVQFCAENDMPTGTLIVNILDVTILGVAKCPSPHLWQEIIWQKLMGSYLIVREEDTHLHFSFM